MSYDKIKIVVSGANGQLAKEIKYISKKNDKYSFQFFRKNELNICKKKDLNTSTVLSVEPSSETITS